MKKLLLFCKDTLKDNEGVIVEADKQYDGYVSDDGRTLTVKGDHEVDVIIDGGVDEQGNSKPYYAAPGAKRFHTVRQLEPMEYIEIETWLPDLKKPPYMKLDHRRTIGEILKDIEQALKEQRVWDLLDYYHISTLSGVENEEPFPEHRFISVFPVKGSSEGYYFHIEVIDGDKRRLLYLGKTLSEDIEEALRVNNVLVKLFQNY